MIEIEDIKIKILEELKNNEWLPPTSISKKTNIHYYLIVQALNELLKENKVIKEDRGEFTFWRLKE